MTETDDDAELKDELKLLVDKILGKDEKFIPNALELLRHLIRTSTTSMTSVPKPLKYLGPHYHAIKERYNSIKSNHTRKKLADIISVLAMSVTGSDDVLLNHDCLNFRLIGTMENVGDWGHEYVRQLESELVEEWNLDRTDTLLPLVHDIIQFDTTHYADIQACDMLMEIDNIEILHDHISKENYSRICLYLANCANYVEDMESIKLLQFVLNQYIKFKEYPKALIIALQLNDDDTVNKLFKECKDRMILRQMAYIAGRQQKCVSFTDDIPDKEELDNIAANCYMNQLFNIFIRELDVLEPKTPDEVYKSWLEPTNFRPESMDSAKQNLAASFVNAFVNAGFSRDKMITTDEGNKWIYRNKDHGMLSATASLGLIHLWDVDGGLTPIDKYLYTEDDNIKAGALMALGIVNCRIRNECDPALALLSDYIFHNSCTLQIGSIFGLGLAYVGTQREDVINLLLPIILDSKASMDVIAMACISCGLISVSSCNFDVTSTILQRLIDGQDSSVLTNAYTKFILLGLGLCHLGRKEAIEAPSAALEVFTEPFKTMAITMLQMCAYAFTGDVLVIQEFLHLCSESSTLYEPKTTNTKEKTTANPKGKKGSDSTKSKSKEKPVKNDFCEAQAIAAIGVAVVSMGEEMGCEMSNRIFGQMVRYGDNCMRKSVPLAIALTSISNPQLPILDILNKYSHDSDDEVCCNAIFAIGLVAAGSNNARVAAMLRQLAGYHSRNPGQLFMVRLAQGLNHLGKGTLTLSPFHTDRQLFCSSALAGLLVTVIALVDSPNIIFGRAHYLLYSLTTAIQPRWLITLDEEMKQISVPVRVGQAVDIVGKAGAPKTISGIHTHFTPVLLAYGERAELATDQFKQMSPVMEGVILLRKIEENTQNTFLE